MGLGAHIAGHARRSIIFYHHSPREVRTYGNEPPHQRHNQHPPQEGPASYQGMCCLRAALRMAQEMGQNVGRGALLLGALPPPQTQRAAGIRPRAARNNTADAPHAKHILEPSNKVRFFMPSIQKGIEIQANLCEMPHKIQQIFVKCPTKSSIFCEQKHNMRLLLRNLKFPYVFVLTFSLDRCIITLSTIFYLSPLQSQTIESGCTPCDGCKAMCINCVRQNQC